MASVACGVSRGARQPQIPRRGLYCAAPLGLETHVVLVFCYVLLAASAYAAAAETAALAALTDLQERYLDNFWNEDGFGGGQGTISERVNHYWQGLTFARLGHVVAAQAYLDAATGRHVGRVPPGPLSAALQLPVMAVGAPQLVAAVRPCRDGIVVALAPSCASPSLVQRIGYAVRHRPRAGGAWSPLAPLDPAALVRYCPQPGTYAVLVEYVLPPLWIGVQILAHPLLPELNLRAEIWNQGRQPLEVELVGWLVTDGRVFAQSRLLSAGQGQVLSLLGAAPLHWASETAPSKAIPRLGASPEDVALPAAGRRHVMLWKRWQGYIQPAQRYVHQERVSLAVQSAGLARFPEEYGIADPWTLAYATYETDRLTVPRVYTSDPLLNVEYDLALTRLRAVEQRRDADWPVPGGQARARPVEIAARLYGEFLLPALQSPRFGVLPALAVEARERALRLPARATSDDFLRAVQALPGVSWRDDERCVMVAPERVVYPAPHPLAGRVWDGIAARGLQTPLGELDLCYRDRMRRGRVLLRARQGAGCVCLINTLDETQTVEVTADLSRVAAAEALAPATWSVVVAAGETRRLAWPQ